MKKIKFAALGAEVAGKTKVKLVGNCVQASDAKEVVSSVEQALDMAKQALEAQKKSLKRRNQEATYKIGMDLLKATKVKSKGKQIELQSVISIDFESLLPMFDATFNAAKRTTAANNIRQVALAFHNFESAYRKFPSPVIVHPETGKKYSWRIAILPFIEQNEIYEAYDFSQEWNSPHNKKVTAQMPDVFRSDIDDKETTNTSWFMLTGPDGMFGKEGASFADIRDGTSNTIMAVEAKRKVHWAKPEDIPVDPERKFPKLGGYHEGGFNVALGDGSVHFMSDKVAEETLFKMYTASGGEVVDHSEMDGDDGN